MEKNFRTKMKEKIMRNALNIKVNSTEEDTTKCDLNLRLLKFFEFEQDPEFENWFDNFCYRRRIAAERTKGEER